eukprot:CAMPEP_0198140768 /NCGR_PEP_ID=MMETSP1443-20131203/3877_1 /TAXON_ID=186043 /ORGANISM="Entomoneis sp., Strain CCMP2396" /LENGTH=155 /DNA_ID=CAMNT_0043803297 /DNA_START=129 /DNA_END=596 /DNA_ORIENTATION=+
MTGYDHDEVNMTFAMFCPELKSRYAVYPFPKKLGERWLTPSTQAEFEGKPVVVLAAKEEEGPKEDYVYCKRGPLGPGYYHVLCKTVYVNLYTRIQNQGNGKFLFFFGDSKHADQWDTCRRIVYNRSRANRPDDVHAAEAAIDHIVGGVPGAGLKL